MLKIALAGNPNAGKTTLFNALTGSTARVGNWTGVTVEKREGEYRKGGEEIKIVDLPGIYSLSPYSPEEKIARNFLLKDTPDCIINVVDATNLERNLYLTTQLMELEIPTVVALNMMDELDKRGDKLDARGLEKALGLPVVEICALKSENLIALIEKAIKASKLPRKGESVLQDFSFYQEIRKMQQSITGRFSLFYAIKGLEGEGRYASNDDKIENGQGRCELNEKDVGRYVSNEEWVEKIANARYTYITERLSPFLQKSVSISEIKFSDRADRVLTHKIGGIPIFLAIMLGVFLLTFGKNSLGDILSKGVNYVTGAIKKGMKSGLSLLELGLPFVGFLCDGVWGGISSVLGFLPQMLLLFLCFSLLEDVGYTARVAFMLDKFFRPFGVSGRAFLPMLMGFGCTVPAIISARTLANEKERERTLRVIPFFYCGAKTPVLLTLTNTLAQGFGVKNPALLVFGFYLLGIVVAFCSLFFMQRVEKGKSTPFIMELPAYRLPSVKNTLALLWEKTKHFLEKAFTIIALSCVVVWGLSHFSFSFIFVGERVERSMLAKIGGSLQLIFTPLGFGINVKESGWVFAVATLAGVVAKEDIVAVLASLSLALTGVESIGALFLQTGVALPALLAFITFNLLTVPCLSALVTAWGELGGKKFVKALLFWLGVSYLVSCLVYAVGNLCL